jgi:hypothetical protein
LTELLAMTLGFKIKRNYDQKQLSALIAALPRILRYKGSKKAVDMAGEALIAASGVLGDFHSEVDNCELIVTFPVGLIDISLFTDLLNYILPAGMTYHIIRKTEWKRPYVDEFDYNDKLIAEWVPDVDFDDNTNTVVGLSNMLTVPMHDANFTNFNGIIQSTDSGDKYTVEQNIGLLDNNIIPILGAPIVNSNTISQSEEKNITVDDNISEKQDEATI